VIVEIASFIKGGGSRKTDGGLLIWNLLALSLLEKEIKYNYEI